MLLTPGLQWIHNSRGELAARTEPYKADSTQRDWTYGQHNQEEVCRDRNAAETEHLWGSDDSSISILGRKVWYCDNLCGFDFLH